MKLVLSASRRTDLVAWYPDELVRLLGEHLPETVHSVVLWTKNARNLKRHRILRETLLRYDQLFLHFSITGMGGSLLEPNIPTTDESLALLPELIELTGSPDRISVRFDPIVNLHVGDTKYTNLRQFPTVAAAMAAVGIARATTSWMTYYKKVARRFAPYQIDLAEFDWQRQADFVLDECSRHGLQLHACCVEGLPTSRCIDGPVLQALHPKGERCSQAKATGQRPRCGCTASKDLGWYGHVCGGGCLYCYATPAVKSPSAVLSLSKEERVSLSDGSSISLRPELRPRGSGTALGKSSPRESACA